MTFPQKMIELHSMIIVLRAVFTCKYGIFCIYVQMLQIWYYTSARRKQR